MFELLVGDSFDVEGDLLTVFMFRVGVVGDRVTTFVHFSFQNQIKLKPVEAFCQWLADGLEQGRISNINREADFR